MADLSYDVQVNTSQAERNLADLQSKVKDVSSVFESLGRVVAGLAIGQFITNSLTLAARLDTLGKVTGIATANLRGFELAVSQAGGNSDQAADAVSDLVKNIGDAANGSSELVSAFRTAGVSLNDLRTLSEQDILKKTIDGIARIGDSSTQSAIKAKIFGEALKTVNINTVAGSFSSLSAQSEQFAASAASARDAQLKMAQSIDKLRESAVIALKPINDFIASIDPAAIQATINTLVKLGIAFAGLFVASKAAGAIKGLVDAQRMLAGASIRSTGIFAEAALGVRQLGEAFNINSARTVASYTGFNVLGITLKSLAGGFIRLIPLVGAAYAAFEILNLAVDQLTGKSIGGWFDGLAASAEQFVTNSFPRVAAALNSLGEKLGMAPAPSELAASEKAARDRLANLKEEQAEVDRVREAQAKIIRGQEAIAKQAAEITKQARAYQLVNAEQGRVSQRLFDTLGFQRDSVRLTQNELEVRTRVKEETDRYASAVEALKDKQATLRASMIGEKDANKIALIGNEIKLLNGTLKQAEGLHELNKKQIEEQVPIIQGLRMAEAARLQGIENTNNAINAQIERQQALGDILRGANQQTFEIRDATQPGQLTGLTSIQRQIVQIQDSARRAAQEAARSFATAFDTEEGLTPERARELADGLDQIALAYGSVAQAQIVVVKNNYEASRTFSAGWIDAFASFRENAFDAGKQAADSFSTFTSGMEDAFVQFVQTGKLSFKSLANSIIADLVRIAVRRAIVAAIGGPLGSLFGMANGGPVQGSTPIIVGERGPELFVPQSAGKIISNSALKGSGSNTGGTSSGGQTVVNYNIQAVDASSFRSLVAKDPSFIYAVTEQGRRSQPTRSR
jgi:lambda family phage tail tape measure protein